MDPTKCKPLAIGVGELLWDLLPSGKQLGGAPANFAYHAQALGAKTLVISRVGDDALGREIVHGLEHFGLNTEGIQVDSNLPTGTVSVLLDKNGTPTFTIHEHVAWDNIKIEKTILEKVSQADVICFGTLAQRGSTSRAAVRDILKAVSTKALRIFDINLRQHFWSSEIIRESLENANVLKLNDDELPIVTELFDLHGNESSKLMQLAERFRLKAVALTKGANGSTLLVDGNVLSHPGTKLRIVDTVGAGDSYTAALALGLLTHQNNETILERAHQVANFVCTHAGAMPQYPKVPFWS